MKVVGGVILAGVASAQDFSYTVKVSGDGCDDSGCADGIATTGVTDPADVKTCIEALAPECGYDVIATFDGTALTWDADVCDAAVTDVHVFKFPTQLDHGLDLPDLSIEAKDLSFDFGKTTAACTLTSYTTWQDSVPDCANDLEQVEPEPPAAPWDITGSDSTPVAFKESLTKNANYLVFKGDPTSSCPDFASLTSPTTPTVTSYQVKAHKAATTVAPPDSTDLVAPSDSTDLVAPGDSSKLVAPGDSSKLVAPGDSTVLVAPGDSTVLVAPGDSSKPVAPGDSSKPVAPGDTTESVGAYAGLTTVSLLIAAACLQ